MYQIKQIRRNRTVSSLCIGRTLGFVLVMTSPGQVVAVGLKEEPTEFLKAVETMLEGKTPYLSFNLPDGHTGSLGKAYATGKNDPDITLSLCSSKSEVSIPLRTTELEALYKIIQEYHSY